MTQMRKVKAWLAMLMMTIAVANIPFTGAFAQTYDLSYSILSNGGGQSTSSLYSLDSVIVVTGVGEGSGQSSATYDVTSVLNDDQPPAAVESWMLY